jgi:N-ethylmaleimide reductase
MTDLFSPGRFGDVDVPNRVFMAPMTRSRAAPGNVPGPLAPEYYAQRASAGLIVTEGSQVSEQGVGYITTPGIHTAAQVARWRAVTDAVHAAGGRIFLQLWHVGRISHPSFQPGGGLPVAPSAINAEADVFTAAGPTKTVTPRALELVEIASVVEQFAQGARNAREAGFDGVEIHGANGYLIDQFLRDGANQRQDAYGGSLLHRLRFLREVVDAVCAAWAPGRVGVRLSPQNLPFNGMHDSRPDETFPAAAAALSGLGLAYLHVLELVAGPMAEGRVPIAPAMRRAFDGPMVVNGAYDREAAQAALNTGEADAVAFGAAFLANPDLPARLLKHTPLNDADPATYYGGTGTGYIDYPRDTSQAA